MWPSCAGNGACCSWIYVCTLQDPVQKGLKVGDGTCSAAPWASSSEQMWPSCAGEGACCSCAHAFRARARDAACEALAFARDGCALAHPCTESCAHDIGFYSHEKAGGGDKQSAAVVCEHPGCRCSKTFNPRPVCFGAGAEMTVRQCKLSCDMTRWRPQKKRRNKCDPPCEPASQLAGRAPCVAAPAAATPRSRRWSPALPMPLPAPPGCKRAATCHTIHKNVSKQMGGGTEGELFVFG